MNDIQVGKLIRKMRRIKELTMVDFAKIIDISQPTLSRIESGNQEITFSLLEKICNEFNISMSYFFQKLEGKNEIQKFEENQKESIDIEEELNKELMNMISSLSADQKKGLYVLLLPYIKD